jgi:hypothetical protein
VRGQGARPRAVLLRGVVVTVLAGGLITPGAAAAATLTPGATFTAAGPSRVLDTRSGPNAAPVTPGEGIVLTLPALPANVSGVVLNLTATGLTGASSTFVSACPVGQDVAACRSTSVLNPVPGATVTNEVTVPVGADGRVRLLNNAGAVDLVADLAGYVSTGYAPVGPSRVLDTRSGQGAAEAAPVTPGDGIVLAVPSLPANASGVVLNLTATGLTGASSTFVSACPVAQDATACRSTSVLNPVPGATVTNEVTVPVGADGQVRLLNNAGAIDLVADLAGYVSTGYAPAGPSRVLDTRSGLGAGQAAPVTPGEGIVLTVPSLPANVAGVVLNLTATGLTGASSTFVSACPVAQDVSSCRSTSVLNPVPGATVTNELTVPVGADGQVRLLNNAGAVDLVADVAGAYVPRTGNDVSYPQCSGTTSQTGALPSGQTFGVVGVNNGLANNTNPCFAAELSWARGSAGGTGQPAVALSVNTANPGPASASWPTSNTDPSGAAVANPYGACSLDPSTGRGYDSAACAYVYGYSRAHDDVTGRIGGQRPADFRWWLDVETTSTWAGVDEGSAPRTPTPSATTANLADLEGMAAYLRTVGAPVGVYSSGYQWAIITGSVPTTSPLQGAPSWLAGYPSVVAARAGCTSGQPLVGGVVALTQYEDTTSPSGRFDYDVSCT